MLNPFKFFDGERAQPGGSDLKGEGQPVEAATDLGYCGSGGVVEAEACFGSAGSLHEQRHRRRTDQVLDLACAWGRYRQRGHGPDVLAANGEAPRLVATTVRFGHRTSTSTNAETPSSTCSQLCRMSIS